MIETKDKILDAAERLFGEQGYSETSLRHIIADAGVNLAAIHYHFGSKEDLLLQLIRRRAEPINQARLDALERIEAEAGDAPVALEKILEAFLAPGYGSGHPPSRTGPADGTAARRGVHAHGHQERTQAHGRPLHRRHAAHIAGFAGDGAALEVAGGGWGYGIHHARSAGGSGGFESPRPKADRVPQRRPAHAGYNTQGKNRGYEMRLAGMVLLAAPLLMGQTPEAATLQLSLKRAVEVAIAPEGSAKIQLADEALRQAQAQSAEARAALLPDLEAGFNYSTQTVNLAAEGLSSAFQIPIAGFQFPTLVGPFSVADARATVQQSVFDFSSIRRFQASKVGVAASRSDLEASAEQVAAQVARAYLEAVKARYGRGNGGGQRDAVAGDADPGGKPKERGNRHGNRNHARQGATGQRPAAPGGGAERAARRRTCNCCAPWECGSIWTWN